MGFFSFFFPFSFLITEETTQPREGGYVAQRCGAAVLPLHHAGLLLGGAAQLLPMALPAPAAPV